MGQWVHKPHVHDHPATGSEFVKGAVWRCECGAEFEVVDYSYNHEDPYGDIYTYRWQRHTKDIGIYAPGTK